MFQVCSSPRLPEVLARSSIRVAPSSEEAYRFAVVAQNLQLSIVLDNAGAFDFPDAPLVFPSSERVSVRHQNVIGKHIDDRPVCGASDRPAEQTRRKPKQDHTADRRHADRCPVATML